MDDSPLATAASLCRVASGHTRLLSLGNRRLLWGAKLEPTDFFPEGLKMMQRRFGVQGPQTQLSQLFTSGVDQLKPL